MLKQTPRRPGDPHCAVGCILSSTHGWVFGFSFSGCVDFFFLPDVKLIFKIFFSLGLKTVLSYAKFNKTAETHRWWCHGDGGGR